MNQLVLEELTARGRGGVSVLGLSGAEAAGALGRLVAARSLPEPGSFALVRLDAGDELLDEALLLHLAPECFELHLHGSPAVVERVVAELGGALERTECAAPGTIEEEAEALLAGARSEAAARVLLDQVQGALRRALLDLEPERPHEFRLALAELIERARWGMRLARPTRVVLVGPVNAGKSTLFNALVGRERVVVSGEAGTTRDAVLEQVTLGRWPVELVDTAGERALPGDLAATDAGSVEQAGQALGRSLERSADLVLELHPASGENVASRAEAESRSTVLLLTRTDEVAAGSLDPSRRAVSAFTDPAGARDEVERLFHETLDLPPDPWHPGRAVPFTAAQLELLERAARCEPAEARTCLESLLGTA